MTQISRIIAAGIAAVLLGLGAAGAQNVKIATVDMQKLLGSYQQTREVEQLLKTEQARIQKDLTERIDHLRKVGEELDALKKQLEDSTVSDKKKQELFRQWRAKQQESVALDREIREFRGRRIRALNELQMMKLREVRENLRKFIEEQAKAAGYDYVFDKSCVSTSRVPLLLYTKDATDITDELLAKLEKETPKAAAPKDGKEKPAKTDG